MVTSQVLMFVRCDGKGTEFKSLKKSFTNIYT